MPFFDFNATIHSEVLTAKYDYHIIGAGAAGIYLAINLSRKGKKVMLIESGHYFEDEERQKLNEVIQTNKVLSNAVWGRKRAIGGTTVAWGGQSLPFTPIDFEKREWVDLSGWPIGYNEVAEHYKFANRFMGVDEMDYREDILNKINVKNPGFDKLVFDFHVSKWAKEPNFFKLYSGELKKNVTVLYNAIVENFKLENHVVRELNVINFKENQYKLNCNILILATGAIESSRLMLHHNKSCKEIVGNAGHWLGKCFMDHPCINLGTISNYNSYALQATFNTHILNGNKYSIRISLTGEIQKKKKLLNCSCGLMFSMDELPFNPFEAIKKFPQNLSFSTIVNLFRSAPSLLKMGYAYWADGFYYKAKALPNIVLMMEQSPVIGSYIELAEIKDRCGIYKAKINWTITEMSWKTVLETSRLIKMEFERLSLGNVNIRPELKETNMSWQNLLSDVNHHMGGTKMSNNPGDGVVDKNLKVWGTTNLFICSSSVFPTVSHSNPTLTILALANRLCDYINTGATS